MGLSAFQSPGTCVPRESQNHQFYPKLSLFSLRSPVTRECWRRRYESDKTLILMVLCDFSVLRFVFEKWYAGYSEWEYFTFDRPCCIKVFRTIKTIGYQYQPHIEPTGMPSDVILFIDLHFSNASTAWFSNSLALSFPPINCLNLNMAVSAKLRWW